MHCLRFNSLSLKGWSAGAVNNIQVKECHLLNFFAHNLFQQRNYFRLPTFFYISQNNQDVANQGYVYVCKIIRMLLIRDMFMSAKSVLENSINHKISRTAFNLSNNFKSRTYLNNTMIISRTYKPYPMIIYLGLLLIYPIF